MIFCTTPSPLSISLANREAPGLLTRLEASVFESPRSGRHTYKGSANLWRNGLVPRATAGMDADLFFFNLVTQKHTSL